MLIFTKYDKKSVLGGFLLRQTFLLVRNSDRKSKKIRLILLLLIYIILLKMSLNTLLWNIKLEFHTFLEVRLFLHVKPNDNHYKRYHATTIQQIYTRNTWVQSLYSFFRKPSKFHCHCSIF